MPSVIRRPASTLPRAQTGPLPYVRISRNRVFRGLAKRGRSTMGWFFGFKLHLRINHKGQLMAFKVTAGKLVPANRLRP
ncbi:MAG: hypothetical protein F4226_01280 [Synechococcus sp. SB0678_bin_12]|nr:hypothetical protein [Synechococcus sp. SB0678_bin_12]MYI87987.1 hypothetical protein [Synechococcus sp. SB0672_bin_10]